MPVVDAGPPAAVPVVVVVSGARVGDGESLGGRALGRPDVAPALRHDRAIEVQHRELALRFRMTLHLELEASARGRRREARRRRASQRLRPDRALSVCAGAAVELVAVGRRRRARHRADRRERSGKSDATRGEIHAGIGLERRFHRFALQAELRAIATGASKAESDGTTTVMPTAGRSPATMRPRERHVDDRERRERRPAHRRRQLLLLTLRRRRKRKRRRIRATP